MKNKDIEKWATFIRLLIVLGAVYFILCHVEIIIRPL